MPHFSIICRLTILLLFMFLAPSSILAAHYKLFFQNGSPAPNYDEMVKSLSKGDSIEFSNGQVFQIYGILGQGYTTLILDVGNNQALRIAPSQGESLSGDPYVSFLEHYYKGGRMLADLGVPMPSIDFEHSLRGQYIIVERVEVITSFRDFSFFVLDPDRKEESERMIKDLEVFATKMAHMDFIEDLTSLNLIYAKHKGWLVLDFMADVRIFEPKNLLQLFSSNAKNSMRSIFSSNKHLKISFDRLPKDVQNRVEQSTRSARLSTRHPLVQACSKYNLVLRWATN